MQAAIDSTQARLEIQKLSRLPAMSLVVHQFLQAVDDRDLEVRQLAAIIEKDAGLLARIIGLANSAYFAYPERVVTAEDAIFKVLGLNTAKGLALSIILSGPFDASRCRGFRLDSYWANAMTVALAAQRLAPHITVNPKPTPGDAYLAGLLHSIGMLAMVHLFPEPMSEVFARGRHPNAEPLLERERTLVGTDHCDVGGWLARKWRLPSDIVAVVERHREADYAGEHWPLIGLIRQLVVWLESMDQDGYELFSVPELSMLGIEVDHLRRIVDGLVDKRAEIHALSRTLAYG